MKVLRGSENAPIEPLHGKTVAIIGYGNQGSAHACNLRDSGITVRIANRRESENGLRAVRDGFDPLPIAEAVTGADLVIIALPDELHGDLYVSAIAPNLSPGATIGFIHGYSIRFGLVKPAAEVGVVMVAPKGPGSTLRQRFLEGYGLPCLLAVYQDSPAGDAETLALAWANGIGCARSGIIYTTFADEAETDLFGEQAVLCGGMTWLILAAFETLVDAGYPPELAYVECCHEVKQVADLVYERGIAGMTKAISNTAEFGAYHAGPMVVDESVRRRMAELLQQIRSGEFAARMNEDHSTGFHWFAKQRESIQQHAIESAGVEVRALMPWLGKQP